VVVGAFLYGQAGVARISAERQLEAVRREISSLQAQGVAASPARAAPETESRQRAALLALEGQGPAMARMLEAMAQAAQQGVTLRSLRVLPDGGHWSVSFDAFAVGGDEAASRQAADRFLRALSESATFGEPLRPPMRRFLPAGGVEIAAAYRVRR